MWSDLFLALRWWVVLLAIGAAATPIAWRLFGGARGLPMLGYAFAKPLGLLLTAYLYWLLGSLGFWQPTAGAALAALLAVAALGVWAQSGRAESARATLRRHGRFILLTELLFLLLFAGMAWARAHNPQIAFTEKPMEIAFLNAIGRSEAFPPLDPWLSGFGVSYYYFGYIMVAVVAQLAAVAEPVAFNLAVAWLFAATGVGAFGLIAELVALSGGARARQWAVAWGLIGALAVPLAGNLQIILETAHGRGWGSAAFWAWLDIRDINTPPDPNTPPRYAGASWWWWRASRPINEQHLSGRYETGLEPIAEFPAFSFLLGDLHPHVLALPFAFLALALALAWQRREPGAARLRSPADLVVLLRDPLFWLTALAIGGLSFLNTWDVLIHLFIIAGAFALACARQDGRWSRRAAADALKLALLISVPGILLYLPFYLGFNSQAGPPFILPMLMRPTRLPQFLVIFGMPLSAIVVLLVALLIQQRGDGWRRGLLTAVTLPSALLIAMLLMSWIAASSAEGAGRVGNLAGELGLTLPQGSGPGWALTAVGRLAPTVLRVRLGEPWLVLLLATLIGGAVMALGNRLETTRRRPSAESDAALPFVLLLILTGGLLTIGPEFLYIRDNFGQRLNTVFKFYYQAWALFGVAAPVGLAWLAGRARPAAVLSGAVYGALLVGALFFPLRMGASRAAEYGGPTTLDGMAFLAQRDPDEYAALQWLRSSVHGAPVILEAIGGQYSEFGRVSAMTGLPTVLGWAGHQYQWRGNTPEPAEREPIVTRIYTQPTWDGISELLDRYEIAYIYVGALERRAYNPAGLAKFAQHLAVVYQNDGVTIYGR